jgi:hypothetical protein
MKGSKCLISSELGRKFNIALRELDLTLRILYIYAVIVVLSYYLMLLRCQTQLTEVQVAY